MKKYIITFYIFIFILPILSLVVAEETKPKVVWKYGVAVINGVPRFIEIEKMYIPDLFISRKTIQGSKSIILKSAKLSLVGDNSDKYIYIYDADKIKDPYLPIFESERILRYKIENNNMYVSKEWDRLHIEIIDDKPKHPDTLLIIHLTCKYFSGEYEIFKH